MAELNELDQANDIDYTNETIVSQDGVDKRAQFFLINALAWAERWDKEYINLHGRGITFSKYNQFSFFKGKCFFPKEGTPLPYVSNVLDPNIDDNLTTYLYDADYHHSHDFSGQVYQIGSVYISTNEVDVNNLFTGTWVRLDGGCKIRSGDGSECDGIPTGSDVVTVPLPKHSHEADVVCVEAVIPSCTTSNNAIPLEGGLNTSGNHQHNQGVGETRNKSFVYGTYNKASDSYLGSDIGYDTDNRYHPLTSLAGYHSHSINLGSHTHAVTVPAHTHAVPVLQSSTFGVNNTDINVLGRILGIAVWQRVS